MKTAVYLSDNIFSLAEATARKLGVSRSRLFQLALEEFIRNHNPQDITEQLNAVYSSLPSSLEPELWQMQLRSIPEEQ